MKPAQALKRLGHVQRRVERAERRIIADSMRLDRARSERDYVVRLAAEARVYWPRERGTAA
jgi:hypothetical protein